MSSHVSLTEIEKWRKENQTREKIFRPGDLVRPFLVKDYHVESFFGDNTWFEPTHYIDKDTMAIVIFLERSGAMINGVATMKLYVIMEDGRFGWWDTWYTQRVT